MSEIQVVALFWVVVVVAVSATVAVMAALDVWGEPGDHRAPRGWSS